MLSELVVKIGADLKEFQSGMDKVTAKLTEASKSIKETGEKMSTFLTLPIVGAGAASIKLASDLSESMNKVNVAFGDSSTYVKDWAKTSVESMGLASGTALDSAALFGDMATSMGISQKEAANMSMSLTQLGADLASFKNIPIDQAMTALNGVFTGETESLKTLGVVMTQTQLEAFALSKGIQKNVKDMTEAEMVNLRYAFVMEKTKNAQGDFARTQDGAANQMRTFQETLKQVGATFGEILLSVSYLNELAKSFLSLSPDMKEFILVTLGIVAAIGPLLVIVGSSIPLLAKMTVGVRALGVSLQFLALNPIGITITAIAALVAVGIALYKNWDWVTKTLTVLFDSWSNGVKLIVNTVQNMFRKFELTIISSVDSILKGFGVFSEGISTMKSEIEQSINADNIENQALRAKQALNNVALSAQFNTQAWQDHLKAVNENAGKTEYLSTKFVKLGEQFKVNKYSTDEETDALDKNKISTDELAKAKQKLVDATMKQTNELGDAIITALKNQYIEQERIQKESLDRQRQTSKNNFNSTITDAKKMNDELQKSYRKTADQNIKSLQETYDAQIRNINIALGINLDAKQSEIDSINKLTEEENRAIAETEFNKSKYDKMKLLSEAKTNDERSKLIEEINAMDDKRNRELLLQKRSDQIDAIRVQMDLLRKQAQDEKDLKEAKLKEDILREQNKLDIDLANLQSNYDLKVLWNTKLDEENTKFYSLQEQKITSHFKALNDAQTLQDKAYQLAIGTNQDQTIKLLQTYNPKWEEAGKTFSQKLYDGILSKSADIDKAIKQMMDKLKTITNATGNISPTVNSNPNIKSTNSIDIYNIPNGVKSSAAQPKQEVSLYVDSTKMASSLAGPLSRVVLAKTGAMM
jgi:hypothetical protein